MSNEYKDEMLKTLQSMQETLQDLKKDVDAMINDLVDTETPSLFDEPEESEPTVSLEDLRGYMADLARKGKSDAIRELLKKHNCEKLSEIPASEYALLMKEAKELANA